MSFDPDAEQVEGEGDTGGAAFSSSQIPASPSSTDDIGTDNATIAWLNKNNLNHLVSSFSKFGATLEVLTMLDDGEIKQLAKETLQLNIIDTAKLVRATKSLKNASNNKNNNSSNNNNNLSDPSSSLASAANSGTSPAADNSAPPGGYIFLGPTEQKYMLYIQNQLESVQKTCASLEAFEQLLRDDMKQSESTSSPSSSSCSNCPSSPGTPANVGNVGDAPNTQKKHPNQGIAAIARKYDAMIEQLRRQQGVLCAHYEGVLRAKLQETQQLLPRVHALKSDLIGIDEKYAALMIRRDVAKGAKEEAARGLYETAMKVVKDDELLAKGVKPLQTLRREASLASELVLFEGFFEQLRARMLAFETDILEGRELHDKVLRSVTHVQAQLGAEAKKCGAGHELMYVTQQELFEEDKGYRQGYVCDICSAMSQNCNCWHCGECNFDVCEKCYACLKWKKFSEYYKHSDIKLGDGGIVAIRPDQSEKCGMAALDHTEGISKGIKCWRFHFGRTRKGYGSVTGMVGISYPRVRYTERTDRPKNVYGIDAIGYFQFNKNHASIQLKWRDGHTKAVIDMRMDLNENTLEFVIVEGNASSAHSRVNSYFKTSIPIKKSWIPCVMFYDKNQKANICEMENETFEKLHNKLIKQ